LNGQVKKDREGHQRGAPTTSGKWVHKRIEYKWVALSVTTIGALMAAIDSTIVILALPQMMERLHADLVQMIWVIMAYILVSTVLLLTFGRFADMFGRVRSIISASSSLQLVPHSAVYLKARCGSSWHGSYRGQARLL